MGDDVNDLPAMESAGLAPAGHAQNGRILGDDQSPSMPGGMAPFAN